MERSASLVCKLPSSMRGRITDLLALAAKGQQKRIAEVTAQLVKAAGLNQKDKVRDLQAERKALRLRGKFINVSNVVAMAITHGLDRVPKDPGEVFDEVCLGSVVVGRPTRRTPEARDAAA